MSVLTLYNNGLPEDVEKVVNLDLDPTGIVISGSNNFDISYTVNNNLVFFTIGLFTGITVGGAPITSFQIDTTTKTLPNKIIPSISNVATSINLGANRINANLVIDTTGLITISAVSVDGSSAHQFQTGDDISLYNATTFVYSYR